MRALTSVFRIASCVMLVLATSAISSAATTQKSLYERLGGKTAITAVIDEFVARVGADKRINRFFAAAVADPARMARLKTNLVTLVCQASGGPCKYTGKDMKTAHKGMAITNADFDALVQDLVGALNKFKVPAKEKSDLLALLGPMRPQIVGQ
ncbi:MAG TPA: group 1 truncated hemoglobin [bacterium]|nr:group 1 truncated hemoglobin [bacterium]